MKCLVIGPGAMILYSFIGVLKRLEDDGHLENLEEISCSSTGAILGVFYVFMKGNFDTMLKSSLEVPLAEIAKPNLKTFIKSYGFIDSGTFEEYIQKLFGHDITFKELYEINPIKIHVAAFNLSTDKTIYMSVDTTPDASVSKAIRKSISIPFIMTPCIENDSVYLDGSTNESSPFPPFLGKTDVVEIRYMEMSKPKNNPKSIIGYVFTLIRSLLLNRIHYDGFKRIDVYSEANILDFKMSYEDKMKLFIYGYSKCLY
jgi:predicted acylesterase/phospholipase RssA